MLHIGEVVGMVLIEVLSGGRRRRCDARCYRGRVGRCRCVCGGKNHGVGFERAMENTRQMAEVSIKRAEAGKGWGGS